MDYYEHTLDPAGVRPDWLADDEYCSIRGARSRIWSGDVRGYSIDWPSHDAIRIPADHWAVPFLRRGETPVKPGSQSSPGLANPTQRHPHIRGTIGMSSDDLKAKAIWDAAFTAWDESRNGFCPGGDDSAAVAAIVPFLRTSQPDASEGLVEITQADRDAAEQLWYAEGTGLSMPEVWPEAFAAHRFTALATMAARAEEAEALLREALVKLEADPAIRQRKDFACNLKPRIATHLGGHNVEG